MLASASFSLVHFGPKFLDLFPELVSVRLRGIVSVLLGMDHVGARCVSMVRRLLVMAGLIMFGCFSMVDGGTSMMF